MMIVKIKIFHVAKVAVGGSEFVAVELFDAL